MLSIHSHYENLRVARNAPPEVIRAAYRALSQRYHPDLNREDADASRIMAILNVAYETLSDPIKRAHHDQWILEQEARTDIDSISRTEAYVRTATEPIKTPKSSSSAWKSRLPFELFALSAHLQSYWFLYLILLAVIFGGTSNSPAPVVQRPTKPYIGEPPNPRPPALPQRPAYIRPPLAPNGQAWPSSAGYIKGYQRLQTNGLGKVTVDNTQNDSDVFAKLVSISGEKAFPIRSIFIPANSHFTISSVRPGEFDVRYRDFNSGRLSRTEPFVLTQNETSEGIHYQTITMTLYKVRDGNMQTFPIDETEFN